MSELDPIAEAKVKIMRLKRENTIGMIGILSLILVPSQADSQAALPGGLSSEIATHANPGEKRFGSLSSFPMAQPYGPMATLNSTLNPFLASARMLAPVIEEMRAAELEENQFFRVMRSPLEEFKPQQLSDIWNTPNPGFAPMFKGHHLNTFKLDLPDTTSAQSARAARTLESIQSRFPSVPEVDSRALDLRDEIEDLEREIRILREIELPSLESDGELGASGKR